MTNMRDDDGKARNGDDADLRDAFADLRREDVVSAPAFEAVLAASRAAPRRRPPLVPVMAGTLVAAGLVAAVITLARRPEPRLPSMASIEQWTAPTDFLLETPGRQLLETVPLIGTTPTLAPFEGAAESRPRTKRRSVSP